MPERSDRPRDLREACLAEAAAVVERAGAEALSLREIARRLGVSHQAPYRHFPSRDHLLAALVARAYEGFARHLDARPRGATAREDLGAMGRAYLAFAEAHPAQYRLMFATPLPDPAAHPEMMARARHAFSLLEAALARVAAEAGRPGEPDALARDALFVWAVVHGLAGLGQSDAAASLGLSERLWAEAVPHALGRIGDALAAPRR